MRGGLFLIAFAACASPATQITVPAQDLLALSNDNGHVFAQVTGDNGYKIDFGQGKIGMPASLLYGNEELLGFGSDTEGDKSTIPTRAGIQLFPVAVYNAGADIGDVTSDVSVPLNGPAVARVVVNWSGPYTCMTGTQIAKGQSEFTLFPNGRIARRDSGTVASSTPISLDDYPCGESGTSIAADNQFSFNSYWTFIAGGADLGSAFTPSGQMCAHYDDVDIAMRYLGSGSDGAATHIEFGDGSAGDFNAIGYVWQAGSTLTTTEFSATTDLRLRPASPDCADALGALANPDIFVTETEATGSGRTTTIRDEDGMYEYGVSNGGVIAMRPANGASIASGWAMSYQQNGFDYAEFTDGHGTPLEQDAVIVEPDGAEGRTVIWFRDALGSDDSIVIHPK